MINLTLFIASLAMAAAPIYASGSDSESTSSITDSETSSSSQTTSPSEGDGEETAKCVVLSKIYHKDESTGETVEDSNNKYGDVYFSQESGDIGDEVIAIINANPVMQTSGSNVSLYKYIVSEVTLNSSKIEATNSEKGEYVFNLSEGNNVFSVTFSGKAEISVIDLANLNWKSLLTVDNLIKLLTVFALLFISSGFFITLIKKGKIQSVTSEQFKEQGLEVMKTVSNQVYTDIMKNTIKPLLEKQSEQTQESLETAKVLMRVTLLAQENTPEARLAITKELQNYKTTDKELAAQIEKIVNDSIAKRDQEEADKKQAIEDVKKAVSNLDTIEEENKEESAPASDDSPKDDGFGSF